MPYVVRGCLGYSLAGASRREGGIGRNPVCSRLLYASKALRGEEKVTHTGQVVLGLYYLMRKILQ